MSWAAMPVHSMCGRYGGSVTWWQHPISARRDIYIPTPQYCHLVAATATRTVGKQAGGAHPIGMLSYSCKKCSCVSLQTCRK